MALKSKLLSWAENNTAFIFSILRLVKPNLTLKGLALITRFNDVQEVLSRPDAFGINYAEKMGIITHGSNFFLGMNNTAIYTRDVSNMRLVVRRTDIDDIVRPMVERLASSIVAQSDGKMDVVQELTHIVPAQFASEYFGTPGPTRDELILWMRDMFAYLFFPGSSPEFDEKVAGHAAKTRDYLDQLIAARKANPEQKDDVLSRCLALQSSNTPGMSDTDIRNNLIGILIGLVPTTSKASALVLDYLLDNPELLAEAQKAARQDDDELLRKFMLESLRFKSFGPGVFRVVNEDYTVAKGNFRSTKIKKGTTVLVATQSAMLDYREVKQPKSFRLDRPDYLYMHFGYGMHHCFGNYINMVQIPLILKAILKQSNLRRAPGEAGIMQLEGLFPSHLNLEFDP